MIYFIQQGHFGPIKIGFSGNPISRLRELQTSHHAHLRMLGEIEGSLNDERRLHEKFSAHRIRREWFTPSQDLTDYIRRALGTNPFLDPGIGPDPDQKVRAPRAIDDIEITPPLNGREGWTVQSRKADLVVFESTLEDALTAFINDSDLGGRFGWDALRFPVEQGGGE